MGGQVLLLGRPPTGEAPTRGLSLYPRSGAALAAYVAGMTLSNGLALAALLSWARALGGASLGLRVAMSTLTLPLLAERQRTCIREWRRFGKED